MVVSERSEDAPLAGLGLKMPLTPAGRPLIDSETDPVNPPVQVMFSA
jgi:hypothetical protein